MAVVVIPWSNFIERRRGDCCVFIESSSLDRFYFCQSQICIYLQENSSFDEQFTLDPHNKIPVEKETVEFVM